MEKIMEATLHDGQKIPYVVKDNPPRGGMKYTYFAPDRSYVVQFYNDPKIASDSNLHARIEAILGRYNPTIPEYQSGAMGNDEQTSNYFKNLFCWPLGVVIYPEFGLVCPTYPSNYLFTNGASENINLQGVEKKSNWFTSKNRKYLKKIELGDFRSMLQLSILLARAVRRMHQAGLAHSDLSHNNVLIDPKSGECVVIDIDSLVVPGLFPPEVVGTRGYIAPEVLSTMENSHTDREYPNIHTDLHSLPVLIYQYLLLRHPLEGPKIYCQTSPEEDDFLALGAKATFIEHPIDRSNRPRDLKYTINDLGNILGELFIRAFVDGLHSPNERPTAMEWERGLVKTWDLLQKCSNPNCEQKWFVFYDVKNPVCPFCKTRLKDRQAIRFSLKSQSRGQSGQWLPVAEINVYENMPLFNWHIFSNIFPDEKADRGMVAYVCKHNGDWLLVNNNITGMVSPNGNLVPNGHAIKLTDGAVFWASREERGMLVEVKIIQI